MTETEIKVGDIFTVDMPETRRLVRLWCWLTRKPVPLRRVAMKVTHSSSAGGWIAAR